MIRYRLIVDGKETSYVLDQPTVLVLEHEDKKEGYAPIFELRSAYDWEDLNKIVTQIYDRTTNNLLVTGTTRHLLL